VLGKIAYVAQFNPGAAKRLRGYLELVLGKRAAGPECRLVQTSFDSRSKTHVHERLSSRLDNGST